MFNYLQPDSCTKSVEFRHSSQAFWLAGCQIYLPTWIFFLAPSFFYRRKLHRWLQPVSSFLNSVCGQGFFQLAFFHVVRPQVRGSGSFVNSRAASQLPSYAVLFFISLLQNVTIRGRSSGVFIAFSAFGDVAKHAVSTLRHFLWVAGFMWE